MGRIQRGLRPVFDMIMLWCRCEELQARLQQPPPTPPPQTLRYEDTCGSSLAQPPLLPCHVCGVNMSCKLCLNVCRCVYVLLALGLLVVCCFSDCSHTRPPPPTPTLHPPVTPLHRPRAQT
jgi:hypothetical protein